MEAVWGLGAGRGGRGIMEAVWGLEAQGLSPTALRHLRAMVAGMSGAKHPGGCSTVAIRIAYDENSDPLLYGGSSSSRSGFTSGRR